MQDISIGDKQFRLVAVERDGQWVARAERTDTGDRFGIETGGPTEDGATARLVRWLTWQHEHTVALEALQQAERSYHRTVAGGAFADPLEGPGPHELQQESLDAVDAARVRLDDVRAQNPEA